jgi:hypothetical protein
MFDGISETCMLLVIDPDEGIRLFYRTDRFSPSQVQDMAHIYGSILHSCWQYFGMTDLGGTLWLSFLFSARHLERQRWWRITLPILVQVDRSSSTETFLRQIHREIQGLASIHV